MKKILFALSVVFSGNVLAQGMSEQQLVDYAHQLMVDKNDISTIELNQMFGGDKLLILPISGFVWEDVVRQLPPQFLRSLTSSFNVRNSADDLVSKINSRYASTSYEESNSLVTRTDSNYTFCLVDDGLRKEFETKTGLLKPFMAGIVPMYFHRSDLFDFVRYHEASHCLDPEYDGSSVDQKFLSTLYHETEADLMATLVSANRNGNFNLFYKLIRPMRMLSVFDMEHTTEDSVAYLIKDIDPAKLKGVPFSQIQSLRDRLSKRLESREVLPIVLKNVYEKSQIGLYLVQKIRESNQPVNSQMNSLLSHNQEVLNSLVSQSVRDGSDLDKRYNEMLQATFENLIYYSEYYDHSDDLVKGIGQRLGFFGVNLNQKTQFLLQNIK